MRGASFSFSSERTSFKLPIEDDTVALSNGIWYGTDKTYKGAIETYQKVLTNKAVKVEEEDKSPDFSKEIPVRQISELKSITFNKEQWKTILSNLSGNFKNEEWLYYGSVSFNVELYNKYFISSEGTKLQWSEPYVRIFISLNTKADDGMSLPLYKSYFAFTPEELPDEKTMNADLLELVTTLKTMRTAPIMTTYSGPAMLSGDASGVFFHEIFGHRIEGQRLKDPKDAQTFKNSIGQMVLPEFLGVTSEPTRKEIEGTELAGYYVYDDEGVKSQDITVVENGIFKNFLMSRTPIEGYSNSNGHGRRQPGYKSASRQANLIVKSSKTYSDIDLRKIFIDALKKEGKEFGLYFKKVQGGFTFTGRSIPNSFNVNPILVYKVYTDGRPDEMVRGVDLIGTPLTTFSNIIATGNKYEVFNGICGAESGGVPVSASSPALLVSKIEVQKKAKSQAKPPILPAPAFDGNQ
jgi:predicted Zn-dependent protease